MKKLTGQTADIVSDNIQKLKQLFPETFAEGKIDFEMLQKVMGNNIETEKERYSFTWHGKSNAIKMSLKQTTGTLRPKKADSKNWDTTKNLFIEGDNLEVLRILQDSYRGEVKMIYIDPPYNTGNDFIYEDNFADNIKNYKVKLGDMMKANPDMSGRYHTNWLNMMYPRLRMAKNLLKEDGVIFISIDDNEAANLKKIMDVIFGEENFIAQVVWRKKYGGGKGTKFFVDMHEYILCYAKNIIALPDFSIQRTAEQKKVFDKEDEYTFERGRYYIRPLKSGLGERKTLIYPIKCPDGSAVETQWICAQDTFIQLLNEGRIVFKQLKDGKYNVYKKFYENDSGGEVLPESLFYDLAYNQNGKEEIKAIFNVKEGRNVPFENAKPIELIKYLVSVVVKNPDIVLDFFAGSASSAHAIMQLNAEDGGNRKFIMVQIPEPTPEDSEAKKAGYSTISEIGKERIRRAGDKIVSEMKDKQKGPAAIADDTVKPANPDALDIGFKVFSLDETNFTKWDPDSKDINTSLQQQLNYVKDDRTDEDAVYEILLKYGIDLTLPIIELNLAGKKVFSLADNYLLICLEDHFGSDTVEEMAKLKPHRVVFSDDGFSDDTVKANAEQTLKKAGVEDIKVF